MMPAPITDREISRRDRGRAPVESGGAEKGGARVTTIVVIPHSEAEVGTMVPTPTVAGYLSN